MKAKLIILENPVIVTDEEIKEHSEDKFYSFETNKVYDCKTHLSTVSCKKVINKPIDYNGIDFGIVDVEKLANAANGYNYAAKETKAPIFNEGFIEGFKASQQLNEKKFTSEDMMKAMEYGAQFRKSTFILHIQRKDEFKKMSAALSLPKTFEVEIEETPTHIKIIKKL